jgi:hypothetical protein
MGELIVGAALKTARIPELSSQTEDVPLSLEDLIPVYIKSEDKTKKVPLQKISDLITLDPGDGAHAPVVYGGELIYKVPLSAAGTNTASIPSIAGKDFTLERGGNPLDPLLPDNSNADTAEYEVLDAGGFRLLQPGDILGLGERFLLKIWSLMGGPGTPGTTGSSGFITGKKVISTNTTLDPASDMNKLIMIRADTASIAVTIPAVEDIPLNSFIPIETNINNSKPATVTTTGGQFIYFRNTSKTSVFMHPGEVLWLFRDDDGLYVINDFYLCYKDLGRPLPSYKADLNELVCKGQVLIRADYPRLWEYVSSMGSSLVSETTWQTANVYRQGNTYTTTPPVGSYITIARPYRGCFSTGDGSTTFRLPDLMNLGVRGVKAETGSDDERFHNKPGGYQDHLQQQHYHTDGHETTGSGGTFRKGVAHLIEVAAGSGAGNTTQNQISSSGGVISVSDDPDDGANYGVENRMENFGTLWVIKY